MAGQAGHDEWGACFLRGLLLTSREVIIIDMKRILVAGLCAAALLFAASCQGTKAPLATKTFEYTDTTDHASLTFLAELPTAKRGAGAAIREDLLKVVVDGQLGSMFQYESGRSFPAYEGDMRDLKAVMDYYWEESLALIDSYSEEDARMREEAIMESEEMDEEEKAIMIADAPGWEYDFQLTMDEDNPRYVVFSSEDYVYMGGAHGGVTGKGSLTFDKKTGRRIEHVIDPDCTEAIQPLLEKGLCSYFVEGGEEVSPQELREWLFIEEGGDIPLPVWEPFPSEEGIVFTYQQYEIAAYAFGMPNFVVPFDEIRPFLTPEAVALLGL